MTQRDDVRTARQTAFNRLKELGGNIDDERKRGARTQRDLATAAKTLINDQSPSTTREHIQIDDPVGGTFNSVNTTFSLTHPVVGQNVHVVHGVALTGITTHLIKGDANPPPAGHFFFDINNPDQIIVGTPPAPSDALMAIYIVVR